MIYIIQAIQKSTRKVIVRAFAEDSFGAHLIQAQLEGLYLIGNDCDYQITIEKAIDKTLNED